MCNTYLATVKKKKKEKKKNNVQEQCNIRPLIVEDHLFLFIILDAQYVFGKYILKSPWPGLITYSLNFPHKRWLQIA